MSVVRIRESPYYRSFFQIIYMRILSGHWKLSAIERYPYWRGVRTNEVKKNAILFKLFWYTVFVH